MNKLDNAINNIIDKQIKKNKNQINNALIEPLSKDYLFSTNGIYFFCARMGSGKTYQIMKHILITERLFKKPYYDTIIFTSTSGSLDKTVSSLAPQVKTPIEYIPHQKLLIYLRKHINNKMKFYAVMEFINNSFNEPSEIMEHILEKYKLYKFIRGKKVYDKKRIVDYAKAKSEKYNFKTYPSFTLLILDDFATNPLIKKVDSELVGILTKTRHYHLTAIICAQTWRFVQLNLKRLCTDIIIWKGFSEEDFKKMITQTPNNQNWKDLWNIYKNLKDKHSNMVIHCNSDEVIFNGE